jgi:hypothetical protein
LFDPASIGTTIIWLNADREREADIERRGFAAPVGEQGQRRNLGRSLARQLRWAADRLDPRIDAGARAT